MDQRFVLWATGLLAVSITALTFSTSAAHAAVDCYVGEHVVYVGTGLTGTIIDTHLPSSCRIHYDGADGRADGWVNDFELQPTNDVAPTAQAPTDNAASDQGPPSGAYSCVGFDGTNWNFRWNVTLDASTYQQSSPDLPVGGYIVNSGSEITFITGPYAQNDWIGLVSKIDGGKTMIVLRDQANETQGPRVKEFENFYCNN